PIFPLARTRHWLTSAAPSVHRSATSSRIADLVRAQLGELLAVDPTGIPGDQPFEDLGLDSIFAMDLADRLGAALRIEVQAPTLYDHDTIDELVAFLSEAPEAKPSAEAAVTSLIGAVLRRLIDPRRSFLDSGFTSIDMLRVVGELERGLGTLPKTLLFDHPDVSALTAQLCALYGIEAVRQLRPSGDEVPAAAASGATIVPKRQVPAGSRLASLLCDLARQHGVESGLAGRDIAPLVFVAADERGYLEFSRSGDRLLVWSYTGPSDGFVGILEELISYVQTHRLRLTVLSPVRLEQVGALAFTATPFGVVQQLEDLAAFTLDGPKLQRLRGMVRRFTRAGDVAVTEYSTGSDPAVDAQLVELVERWAAGKRVVNPYAYTIREELRGGALPADHRVFLTSVDGVLRAAVIVTRMSSELGYLLDAEFYGDDMPAGGLEYSIVQIIEALRTEGVTIFSFGATFGVKVCDSPNTSPEVERALDELSSSGMLGRGNYQFKSKFRPDELPIYLCQPADRPTSVADVLVMIGSPEPLARSPLQLAHRDVSIDLLTDSWAERDDPWIAERMRGLEQAAAGASDTIDQPWLPFTLVLSTPSGRTAEALLCRSWPGRRGTVLHNGLFPTWLFNLADQRFTPVALPGLDEGTVLEDALARDARGVSFVVVELSCNAAGGRPLSLPELQHVAATTRARGVPLVLDATRLVENAVSIADHARRDVWDVGRELLALGDAATFSLSKDWGVNFGGLVASRIPELDDRLREEAALRGTDVGLASRRLLQVALGDLDAVLGQVRQRMAAVHALAKRLADAGLPVVAPVGGHCVLVDVDRVPGFAGRPIEEFLTQVFDLTGVRGGPHLAGDAYPELRTCCRLAVPVGLTVEAAERAGALLVGTRGARTVPEEWFSRQLHELGTALTSTDYAPANQNLDVLRELVPAIECRMVTVAGGEVEVFSAGSGPTLLLMQPFNIGAGIFAPQFATLSDRFRIIVIHQPGVGRTRVIGSLSLEGIASLQRHVLAAIGIDEPIHIGGASVGAIFAQYFALRFPELTRSLSLIGGSYRFANRKGQIDRLEQVIAEDFDAIATGSGVPCAVEDRDRFTQFLLRCESMDPQTGLGYLDLFAKEPALAPRLNEISAPTLILHGRHDSVVGVKTGHFLHGAIPDARYVDLPRSGHFVCVTDSDAVNAELAAFLDEIVTTSRTERTRRAGSR
ncbi:MAG: alpha/beta fold hydrolase, partial [Deltaproteobacteria bacterium]